METALMPARQDTGLIPVMNCARHYISSAKAASTVRAYRCDWRDFTAWCSDHGLSSLPADPQTVSLYLADTAPTHKAATLQRRISAISKAHQSAGYESPASMRHAVVSETWKGIKRVHGTAQEGKLPVLTENLRSMIRTLPPRLLGIRDRALLLIGFAGAFRRSELVGLNVEDTQFTADGLIIVLRRSKTDQEGEGRKIGIPYGSNLETCPVRALRAWLEAASISYGPLFRSVNRHGHIIADHLSDKAVALVVKRCATAAGLDQSGYAGHSLRSGLVTSAAINGASEWSIMNQTGHRSVAMVRRYIRDGSLFRENAAARVGL